MDLAGSLNKAIEIVKLNGSVAAEVGRDEQSLQPGLVFIAVSGLAAGIAAIFSHGGIGGLITMPIMAIVGYFVGVGILHLVATHRLRRQGGLSCPCCAPSPTRRSSAGRGSSRSSAPSIGLWHLPVTVVILENVYGMPRNKAIATVAVIAGFFLLLGLVMALFFGALLGGLLMGMGAGR